MALFLGVAKALKAMHQYRVKGAPGGPKAQAKAKGVRDTAARADADAARQVRGRGTDDDDEDNVPLMEDEITQSQAGIGAGELRAYAHRDIQPGM